MEVEQVCDQDWLIVGNEPEFDAKRFNVVQDELCRPYQSVDFSMAVLR